MARVEAVLVPASFILFCFASSASLSVVLLAFAPPSVWTSPPVSVLASNRTAFFSFFSLAAKSGDGPRLDGILEAGWGRVGREGRLEGENGWGRPPPVVLSSFFVDGAVCSSSKPRSILSSRTSLTSCWSMPVISLLSSVGSTPDPGPEPSLATPISLSASTSGVDAARAATGGSAWDALARLTSTVPGGGEGEGERPAALRAA